MIESKTIACQPVTVLKRLRSITDSGPGRNKILGLCSYMKLRANVNLEFVSFRAVSSTRSDLSV